MSDTINTILKSSKENDKDYMRNYYALALSIVKRYSVSKSLHALGLSTGYKRKEL